MSSKGFRSLSIRLKLAKSAIIWQVKTNSPFASKIIVLILNNIIFYLKEKREVFSKTHWKETCFNEEKKKRKRFSSKNFLKQDYNSFYLKIFSNFFSSKNIESPKRPQNKCSDFQYKICKVWIFITSDQVTFKLTLCSSHTFQFESSSTIWKIYSSYNIQSPFRRKNIISSETKKITLK